jgi:predicted amino acid-binding ACT domain protein
MDKAKVKEAILKVAGNPESGVIADLADEMAEAIINIGKPEIKKFEPVKKQEFKK